MSCIFLLASLGIDISQIDTISQVALTNWPIWTFLNRLGFDRKWKYSSKVKESCCSYFEVWKIMSPLRLDDWYDLKVCIVSSALILTNSKVGGQKGHGPFLAFSKKKKRGPVPSRPLLQIVGLNSWRVIEYKLHSRRCISEWNE